MLLNARCRCGRYIPVDPIQAGQTVTCLCGEVVEVPPLGRLRREAGLSAYDPDPAERIAQLAAAGELPCSHTCVGCGKRTEEVVQVQAEFAQRLILPVRLCRRCAAAHATENASKFFRRLYRLFAVAAAAVLGAGLLWPLADLPTVGWTTAGLAAGSAIAWALDRRSAQRRQKELAYLVANEDLYAKFLYEHPEAELSLASPRRAPSVPAKAEDQAK